ncbi:unnamed protein product, partial [Scytosiphon promiscuus]
MAPLRSSAGVTVLRAAALLRALIVITAATGFAKSEPCEAGTVNMTVASTEDAIGLTNALACTGEGVFRVSWNGSVELAQTVVVGAGSSLNVTGALAGAEINGGGLVQLFDVTGATVHLEKIALSQGAINGSG